MRHSFLIAALAIASSAAAHAQDPPPTQETYQAPAHISLVDGVAILERDGQADDSPTNMPLLAGDRVRTRSGRVEILFTDGSTLHLDHNTTIDLQSDELVRLTEGRIRLSIPGPNRDVSYRIDGPFGWALIQAPGEYRMALFNGLRGAELELTVLRGRAEFANEDGQTSLRAGERAFARTGAAPSYAYVANSATLDAFDRWSEARRDERMGASAEYLPEEVRPYAASFSRYGYWQTEPTYGRVWYPRVDVGWRPYYRGRWVVLRPYGWTWVAYDPWGWPTHHYGRWGYSTAGWFWIPGRTWGAAWVSWAYAPGYVSWCPLGWNNRPVFQINVNIGRRYDPWRAWTVIPRHYFGTGYVHRHAVHIDRLDHRVRTAFAYRDVAPETRGHAVARGSVPIRTAGRFDGRPSGLPTYTNLPAERARTTIGGQRVPLPAARESAPSQDGQRPRAVPRTAADGVRSDSARAVARERTVPDRPAVRVAPPRTSADVPGRSNNVEVIRGGQRSAVPRGSDEGGRRISPQSPDRDAQWQARPGTRAVPRSGSPVERPESRSAPGSIRSDRPADTHQWAPRATERSRPPDNPSGGRAIPRGDYGRPTERPDTRPAPQFERRAPERIGPPPGARAPERAMPGPVRGPERPAAGSNERRAPAASQPPRGGGRPNGPAPSAPPGGARPRGGVK